MLVCMHAMSRCNICSGKQRSCIRRNKTSWKRKEQLKKKLAHTQNTYINRQFEEESKRNCPGKNGRKWIKRCKRSKKHHHHQQATEACCFIFFNKSININLKPNLAYNVAESAIFLLHFVWLLSVFVVVFLVSESVAPIYSLCFMSFTLSLLLFVPSVSKQTQPYYFIQYRLHTHARTRTKHIHNFVIK